jgi:mRNA interferase MazF
VDLTPTRGHEQEGDRRPALIVSANGLNASQADLVIVVPITKAIRDIPFHVRVTPSESGLDLESSIMCEQMRSISRERLIRRIGNRFTPKIMIAVEDKLKILLNLK